MVMTLKKIWQQWRYVYNVIVSIWLHGGLWYGMVRSAVDLVWILVVFVVVYCCFLNMIDELWLQ